LACDLLFDSPPVWKQIIAGIGSLRSRGIMKHVVRFYEWIHAIEAKRLSLQCLPTVAPENSILAVFTVGPSYMFVFF
jgi:hypothetical protein